MTEWRERLVLTVTEAADLLRVDPRTLRRSIEAGEAPGVKVSGVWRVPVAQFVKFVDDPKPPGAQGM